MQVLKAGFLSIVISATVDKGWLQPPNYLSGSHLLFFGKNQRFYPSGAKQGVDRGFSKKPMACSTSNFKKGFVSRIKCNKL